MVVVMHGSGNQIKATQPHLLPILLLKLSAGEERRGPGDWLLAPPIYHHALSLLLSTVASLDLVTIRYSMGNSVSRFARGPTWSAEIKKRNRSAYRVKLTTNVGAFNEKMACVVYCTHFPLHLD